MRRQLLSALIFLNLFSFHESFADLVQQRVERAAKKGTDYSFFYTIPDELSAQEGWAYAAPECMKFSSETAKFEKCEYDRAHDFKNCLSGRTAKVIHTETGEERAVKLRFLFFSTKQACEKDRSIYLTGGEGG